MKIHILIKIKTILCRFSNNRNKIKLIFNNFKNLFKIKNYHSKVIPIGQNKY